MGAALLVLAGSAAVSAQTPPGSVDYQEALFPDNPQCPGFMQSQFRQIGPQGFGDPGNSYAWSMEYFNGKIYIGSNRWFLCLIKQEIGGPATDSNPNEFPLECPANLLDLDLRARIFEFDPATNKIKLVYISPTFQVVQSDGTIVNAPRDYGYRAMKVFKEADGTEALYIGTFISRQYPSKPARILRTLDGRNFEEIRTPFSDNNGFTALRASTIYKDRLYFCNIGSDQSSSVVIEAEHPETGDFHVINPPFFGDETNDTPYALGVFNGYLYVGVANPVKGFYVYKTQCAGEPPYSFTPVMVNGAYRGKLNETVMQLVPYNGYLYVGSGILFGGHDVLRDVGPAPAEMLRIHNDDTWDLLCGGARNTPVGYKYPLSGGGAGFGNPWTGYMWRMTVYNNVLYLGTFDSSYIAEYINGVTLKDLQNQIMAVDPSVTIDPRLYPGVDNVPLDEYFDVITALEGGFDLYETNDGLNWVQATRTGFNDKYNYGVRSYIGTPFGLFLGATNPFYGFKIYLGQPSGTDSDGDGIPDVSDNCPFTFNQSQSDVDGDGIGDACDNDNDLDGLVDKYIEAGDVINDPIPGNPQSDFDTDGDGVPDRLDPDIDNDGIPNELDNCPYVYNFTQADSVGDGVGDACRGTTPKPEAPSGLPEARDLRKTYINATTQPAISYPEPQLQPRPHGAGGSAGEPNAFVVDPNHSSTATPGTALLNTACPGLSLVQMSLTGLGLFGLQSLRRRRP